MPMAIATTLLVMILKSPLQERCGLRLEIVSVIMLAVMMLTALLIVVMGTILCYRACRRRSLTLSEYDKQHKNVLYEMLPLLLYPILFLLTSTPIFVVDSTPSYNVDRSLQKSSYFMFAIFTPLWSFTTSLLLTIHLCVVQHVRNKKLQYIALHKVKLKSMAEEESVILNETTKLSHTQRSDTHFTSPVEE